MTSLEQRRVLLMQCQNKLAALENVRHMKPLLENMLQFMETMLEEDEANTLVNLLRREGMDR